MKQKSQRYWQIDLLRGIAIMMMISYHILFDLDFLNIISFPLHSFYFRLYLYPIGTLFLLLVGISLVLSYKKYINLNNHFPPFIKYLKRGLFLFSIALLITAVTWIYPHDGFIIFGVIHCISISIILSYWFISKPIYAISLGIIFSFIGIYLYPICISNPYFYWIGLNDCSFYTLDYFPLLPWFGIILIGIFLGYQIYPFLEKKHKELQKTPLFAKPITFLGNHSLIIYLIHQPIIFGFLFFIIH